MKKLITLALFFIFMASPVILRAAVHTVTFFIDGMDCCGSTESQVSATLEMIYGVVDYSTDSQSQTITVTYDDKLTSLEELVASLRKEGFNPEKL